MIDSYYSDRLGNRTKLHKTINEFTYSVEFLLALHLESIFL